MRTFFVDRISFLYLFCVFWFNDYFAVKYPKHEFLHSTDFKNNIKTSVLNGTKFYKNSYLILSILDSYINHLFKSCDSFYRMKKNINYEILLLLSSLKIMCVCACVCTHMHKHTNYACKPIEHKFSLCVVLLIIEK
jgi:hypothetical protein